MIKHNYGLITLRDADTLEATLTLACLAFPSGTINITEIGVHRGKTARGIHEYITHIRGRKHKHIGVDNEKDLPIHKTIDDMRLLLGDSKDMALLVSDNSQHVLFIDGLHSFSATVTDFAMYCDKLIKNGYLIFHDTSPNIPAMKDYQEGDKEDPNSYIACRRAVEYLGLMQSTQWQVIFDEYDSTSDYGGMIVLKKMY